MKSWQWSTLTLVLRTRAFWTRLVPLVIGTAIATMVLGLLAAAQLSPSQQIQSELGDADGVATMGKPVPVGQSAAKVPSDGSLKWAVTELSGSLELASPKSSNVLFVETDWERSVVKGRYELLSGRWPTTPGEIAVSPTVPAKLGDAIRAVVGGEDLQVVGVARLDYSTNREALFAGRGTWAAWQTAGRDAERSGLVANARILFASPDPEAACRAFLKDKSFAGDSFSCETRRSLQNVILGGSPVRFLIEQGLPALAVQLLAAALAAGLLTRFLRRVFRPLSDVGLSRNGLGLVAVVLSVIGTALSVVVGLLVGTAGVLIGRPLLASQIDHPMSPPELPGSAMVGSVATLLTVLLAVRPLQPRRQVVAHALTSRAAGAAAALGCFLIALSIVVSIQLPKALSTVGMVALGASIGFALLAPQLILLVGATQLAPGRRLAAVRSLASNSRTYAVHVGITGALVGLICSSLALVGGLVANLNQNSGTGIPQGMVLLNVNEDGRPKLDAEVVKKFEGDLGLGKAVVVWRGVDDASNGDQTPWWAFSTVDDLRSVFPNLNDTQVQAAAQGGLELTPQDSGVTPDLPRELRWLRQLRVATKSPKNSFATSRLYVGLSPDQDKRAATWADANALAPGYVNATDIAPDVPVPALTAASALAFALGTGLMSSVAMRGELSALRGLLVAFNAIGLGRRWCFGVIMSISLILSALAIAIGWCSAIVTSLLVSLLLDGALLLGGVPWLVFGAIGIGTAVGGLLGGTLSSYRFAAQEVNGR